MNIRDHSSQFTVYVFTPNVDPGASVKVYLSQAGYDAYFFQDLETLEQRLKENAPHILVFSAAHLQAELSDFVKHVRKINVEIVFIALAPLSQFEILAQYKEQGFFDIISDEMTTIESRVVWSVDNTCEKIYQTYTNEQIFDDLELLKEQSKPEKLNPPVPDATVSNIVVKSKGPPVSFKIGQFRAALNKEEMVQIFLNNVFGSVCIYFKYLPSVRSFLATHANGIDANQINGVGCQLDPSETVELEVLLGLGNLPLPFARLLKEAFHFDPAKIIPVFGDREVEGVFVYSGRIEADAEFFIMEEFSIFSICNAQFNLEKKVDILEVQDYVTGLRNRNFYLQALEDEIVRSRRLRRSVSVVKISIDNLYEIESAHGEANRDLLLKLIAEVLIKGSRATDYNCRTAFNTMAIILPLCSKKGAALRAERIRRTIEGETFLDQKLKVSVSLGVSEFPTLCVSSKSLDETANRALDFIQEKGGNKICLYKAPSNHRPEFEISHE